MDGEEDKQTGGKDGKSGKSLWVQRCARKRGLASAGGRGRGVRADDGTESGASQMPGARRGRWTSGGDTRGPRGGRGGGGVGAGGKTM
jgi:hypothetical protein